MPKLTNLKIKKSVMDGLMTIQKSVIDNRISSAIKIVENFLKRRKRICYGKKQLGSFYGL